MMNGGFHHLHQRKRHSEQKLEPYPSSKRFVRALDYLMYGGAIIAPAFLVPQVIAVYQTQDASNLSLIAWAMMGTMNLLWCLYGLVHHEMPIIFGNIAFAVLNFAIVAAIFIF